MKEDSGQEKVAVQLRIELGDAVRDVQEVHDVLDQPSLVCVMVLDAGRCRREFPDEVVIDQEALDHRPQMGIVHREENLAQARHQLRDVLFALRQEVFGLDLRGIDNFKMVEDDLKGTLENLGSAAHMQKI